MNFDPSCWYAGQKDVYALEASPEPEEAKPALSQAAIRSEDPSGQQSKQKSPKEAAQILTADPSADVQKEKPAVKRSHQPDTKEDQKQRPISKTSPEADAPVEVLQNGKSLHLERYRLSFANFTQVAGLSLNKSQPPIAEAGILHFTIM